MKFDPTLYLVTDSTGRTDDDFLSILEKALTGGVTLVQLREKERGGGEYLRLARLTKAVCDRYRVPLIIDDRADIAMAADAAGVHVGQSDLPVCEARKLLGEDKIVGATAKTVEQAQKAYREARGLPRHGRDLPDDHEGENRADAGFAPERCLPQRADPGRGHRRFKCREHGCFEWQSH